MEPLGISLLRKAKTYWRKKKKQNKTLNNTKFLFIDKYKSKEKKK